MSQSLQELKSAALELPSDARFELAAFLLNSVVDFDNDKIRNEWSDLATERMEDIRSGREQGIPADEVHRRLLDSES